MGIEKLLGKIYYDPKEGFMGVNNLFMKAGSKIRWKSWWMLRSGQETIPIASSHSQV